MLTMFRDIKKEIKAEPKGWAWAFGLMVVVGIVMVGLWIISDPSLCHEKTAYEQNRCIGTAWMTHLSEIALPTLVTIMVIRILRDDPNDKNTPTKQDNPSPAFDYSKMGANASNDKIVQESGN